MTEQKTSLDIGRVLSATFGVISRHPLVFIGLALIVTGLPYGLVQYFALSPDFLDETITEETISVFEDRWTSYIVPGLALFAVYFVLTILLQAMLVVATIRDLRGQNVDIGDCLTEALNRFLPLVGLAIVSLLGILVGLLFFIIPGIIFFLMWMVATPVMMAEKLGIVDSLTRSAKLTSNSKGMIILLAFIYLVAATAISGFAEALGFFNSYASVVSTVIGETAIAALQAAGIAALYIELRTIKEGPLTEGLADVFS